MERIDCSVNQETTIFAGKTLSYHLKEMEHNTQLLFITNQRFATKINQLFPNQEKIDWYVCVNNSSMPSSVRTSKTSSFGENIF